MSPSVFSVVRIAVGLYVLVPAFGSSLALAKDPSQSELSEIARGNNRFALQLYSQLKDSTPDNLFFSPYSISTALAMTYAGAAGDTKQQMAETLQFSVPEPNLHSAMAKLMSTLQLNDKGCQFRVANRLWGQTGYKFLPEFLQTTRSHYGAELGEVDFASQSEVARRTINQWVEKQTELKIKELITPGLLNAKTRLVLTNAIYFKGLWLEPFDKKATEEATFYVQGDNGVNVHMMHQVVRGGYQTDEGLQILELPYANQTLSMVILLPADRSGLADLENKLSENQIANLLSGLKDQNVAVYLPRFRMNSQFSLRDALVAMGMKDAFDDGRADFSRMSSSEQLVISAVIHKAFVEVNEEGTEAAAATGVIMAPTAAPIRAEPPTFRADHPFLFLIRDKRTGSIVFIGRVANPTS